MVDLMEEWTPLLPPWILDNVLDQFLMPKIQAEVDSWDPTTDTVPIHSWIHPWLPILSKLTSPVLFSAVLWVQHNLACNRSSQMYRQLVCYECN